MFTRFRSVSVQCQCCPDPSIYFCRKQCYVPLAVYEYGFSWSCVRMYGYTPEMERTHANRLAQRHNRRIGDMCKWILNPYRLYIGTILIHISEAKVVMCAFMKLPRSQGFLNMRFVGKWKHYFVTKKSLLRTIWLLRYF